MNRFNIRVYGIMIINGKLLVCKEKLMNNTITKFPGGGLEFGEGLIDCVKREFMEELNVKIDVTSHFYTTDFFVPSIVNSNQQVISVYYLVSLADEDIFPETTISENPDMVFYWLPLSEINEKTFSLPIDKKVGLMLRKLID